MVCIQCGKETKVTNSRLRKRSNQVWRRRECQNCHAIFTTEETVHYETAWTVRSKTGSYQPFMPDKLTLSIYRSIQHRPNALSEAVDLCNTVIQKIQPKLKDGFIDSQIITNITQVALNRFDSTASAHYQAFHKRPYQKGMGPTIV